MERKRFESLFKSFLHLDVGASLCSTGEARGTQLVAVWIAGLIRETLSQTTVKTVPQAKLKLHMEEELDLLREIEKVEKALKEEAAQNSCLKEQTDVRSSAPDAPPPAFIRDKSR